MTVDEQVQAYLDSPQPRPVFEETIDAVVADAEAAVAAGRVVREHGPEMGRCVACGYVCSPDERDCPRCGEPAVTASSDLAGAARAYDRWEARS